LLLKYEQMFSMRHQESIEGLEPNKMEYWYHNMMIFGGIRDTVCYFAVKPERMQLKKNCYRRDTLLQ
jgi:hypothetical protein